MERVCVNPHAGYFDELMLHGMHNGMLYLGGSGNVVNPHGFREYKLDPATGVLTEIDGRGKIAWRSAPDYPNNKIYIAGEAVPVGAQYATAAAFWAACQTMVGYIDLTDDSVHYWTIPGTADTNEIVGLALDTAGRQLFLGERSHSSASAGSNWPNGHGIWVVPLLADGSPNIAAANRFFENAANNSIGQVEVFANKVFWSDGNAGFFECPASGPAAGNVVASLVPGGVGGLYGLHKSAHYSQLYALGEDTFPGQLRTYAHDGTAWGPVRYYGCDYGAYAAELSDGNFVVFSFEAYPLVRATLLDPVTGAWDYITPPMGGDLPGRDVFVQVTADDLYFATVKSSGFMGAIWKLART